MSMNLRGSKLYASRTIVSRAIRLSGRQAVLSLRREHGVVLSYRGSRVRQLLKRDMIAIIDNLKLLCRNIDTSL